MADTLERDLRVSLAAVRAPAPIVQMDAPSDAALLATHAWLDMWCVLPRTMYALTQEIRCTRKNP